MNIQMIKKPILIIAALLMGSLSLSAQDALKVGIVDINLVLQQYDKFNEAKAELDEQKRRADAELRPMVDSMNELQQEMGVVNGRINNPTSSEEAQMQARNELRKMEAELQQKAVEFQRLRAKSQNTIAQREQNMLSLMLSDVSGAAATVADEKGLSLVLTNQNQLVLYFDSALEISDEVLTQLQKGSDDSK